MPSVGVGRGVGRGLHFGLTNDRLCHPTFRAEPMFPPAVDQSAKFIGVCRHLRRWKVGWTALYRQQEKINRQDLNRIGKRYIDLAGDGAGFVAICFSGAKS